MGIQEFIVTEPPTSGEVRARIAAAWLNRELFNLTLVPVGQEVPPPQPRTISVDMRGTHDPKLGESEHTVVLGTLVESEPTSVEPTIVRIHIQADLTKHASVTI